MNEHESADKKLHSRLQKKKLGAQSEPGAGELMSAARAFTVSLSRSNTSCINQNEWNIECHHFRHNLQVFLFQESKERSGRKKRWTNGQQRKPESMLLAVSLRTERTKKNERNWRIWWGLGWQRRTGWTAQITSCAVLGITGPLAS